VTPDRLRIAIRFGLYALVLLAPLPFGSVQPGYVLAIELIASAIGVLSMALLALDEDARAALPKASLLLCGAIVLLGVFQILPLPFSIAERFNPTADLVRPLLPYLGTERPPTVTWSVAPAETTDALLRFVAYVWIGLGAVLALDTTEARRGFAIALVASAAFQAVYGSGEYLTGRQHIFSFAKKHYLDSATGTFINRNHYATFLAMALPFALGLALPASTEGKPASTWRGRLLSVGDREAITRILAGACAAAIWLGLLLSSSRAGLGAAFLAALLVLVPRRRARAARWAGAIAAVVLLGLLTRELARLPGERLLSARIDLHAPGGRLSVWRDAGRLVATRPGLGWGLGTFEGTYPTVRSLDVSLEYDHAHNDWLEWSVEGGLATTVLAVALGLLLIRRTHDVARAALAAVLFHAIWDFSLRIPSIPVTAAAVAGAGLTGYRDWVAARASVKAFPPASMKVWSQISRLSRFQIR